MISKDDFNDRIRRGIRLSYYSCLKYIKSTYFKSLDISVSNRYGYGPEDLYHDAVISMIEYHETLIQYHNIQDVKGYCFDVITRHAGWIFLNRRRKYLSDREREKKWGKDPSKNVLEDIDVSGIDEMEVNDFIRDIDGDASVILSRKMRGDNDIEIYSSMGRYRFEKAREYLREKFLDEFRE